MTNKRVRKTLFLFFKSIYISNITTMKKIIFIILLLFAFIVLDAQSYDTKEKIADLGTWNKSLSTINKISVSSYVTKQKILTYTDYAQKQKTVSSLPKYRYELILTSSSICGGELNKTWIYGAKIFINGCEVTHDQFPNGFTAIIETKPTTVYWYESNTDGINIKISWQNSVCCTDNK